MPIDPGAVQWDSIDPSAVRWDDTPASIQHADAAATSPGQAFTIGAGRMGDRMWEGVKQGGYGTAAILSELLPDRLKQVAQDALAKKLMAQQTQQADNTSRYKPIEEAHPVATTLGEAAPLAAAPMLRVVEGAGALPAMVNAATSAAAPAALEYGTAAERGTRATLAGAGGAVGQGVMSAGAKVLKPVQNLLTPEQQRLAQVAQDAGINLTAGQKTGNKFLQTVESTFEGMPATSGTATAQKQAQRVALTRAVMGRLGVPADEATDATLGAARTKIGGDFDRIFTKVNVPIDTPQTQQALSAIVQDANATLPADTAKIVSNRVGQLIDKADADGNVSGKAYQAWRTEVQKQAAGAGNGWLSTKLRDVYRSVDQAAYDAAHAVGEAENLTQARASYRDLLTAEAAMKNVSDGLIPAGTLLSAANKSGTDGMIDLARSAKAFVKDQIPNSGTAQRQIAQQLMGLGMDVGVGGVTYGITQDPGEALKAGLLAGTGRVLLPKIAQAAVNSGAGQRYLTNGLTGRQLSPLEQALTDRAIRLGSVEGSRALVER